MTKAETVTEALRMAREEFQLVALGGKQWQLQSYDARAGAWRALDTAKAWPKLPRSI